MDLKITLRFCSWAVLLISLPTALLSQASSFQSTMLDTSQAYYLWRAAVNEADEVALFLLGQGHNVISFQNPNGVNNGFKVKPITADSFQYTYVFQGAALIGNDFVYTYNYQKNPIGGATFEHGLVLTTVNLTTGEGWGKHFDYGSAGSHIVPIHDGSFLLFRTAYQYNRIAYTHFDLQGNKLGQGGYELQLPPNSTARPFVLSRVEITSDGNVYLLGFFKANQQQPNELPFIARVSTNGEPPILKSLDGITYNNFVLTPNGPLLMNYGSENTYNLPLFDAHENARLVQLDNNLNFLWAKEYEGEHFPYFATEIGFSSSGRLLLSHSTIGTFPVVLTELDDNGNIISQKGYPSYLPELDLLNDGSILISSARSFDENGNTSSLPVIIKTDTNGDVEGCTTLPTCLTAKDVAIGLNSLNITPIAGSNYEDIEVETSPISITFTQGCNFPPAPTPEFTFPDTLCIGETGCATNTTNRLANAYEWKLTGPGVNILNTNSFDFCHKFLTPGSYRLQQTIWVLGCSTVFEKEITVLPALEIAIGPSFFCPDEAYELHVSSNRPLLNYEWNTGNSLSVLPLDTSGTYALRADDGYCSDSSTINVRLLSDLIGEENPFQIPQDAVVCDVHLPYDLRIESLFSDTFFIQGKTVEDGIFPIDEAGHYIITTEIESCIFSKVFSLDTMHCKAAVYFPNAISPNGDGINDAFFPQGGFFEAVSLKIFDRWGGKRFDGKGTNTIWEPDHNGLHGTYLYHFTYQNTLTGELESISGNLVLLR